jgi:hypothetical protein
MWVALVEQRDKMRLFELEADNLATSIVVVADQLKSDIEDGSLDTTMTTDDLLQLFQDYNVPLDRDQLFSMYKVPPLDKIIDNINDDVVTFKGGNSSAGLEDEASEQEKTVAQMAKSAMK